MNKTLLSIVIVAVVAIALGTAGFVYAQAPTPQTPVPGNGYGPGMMNGQNNRGGMMGGQGKQRGMANQNAAGTQDGLLHDDMIAVYAEKLGISVEDLNARLADARSQAIDQAVKDGTLTQVQADWMKQRGAGMVNGGRGMRGNGQGRNANPDCPYYPQTQP